MLLEKITHQYEAVVKNLHSRRVYDAIEGLRQIIQKSNKEFLAERLDNLKETYKNLLRYSFATVQDPEREKVYTYLIRSLLELADEVKEMILTEASVSNVYRLKNQMLGEKRLERGEIRFFLESLTYDRELSGILNEKTHDDNPDVPVREDAIKKVFNIIWLTDRYNDAEIELLNTACQSPKLPWHDKALIVSALTLSLLRYFDLNKFLLLFRFVAKREGKVWERALIGIFISSLKYSDRFYLYPALEEKTLEFKEFPEVEQNIEAIVIQFTKAKETQMVLRKWEEEILPDMLKMRSKIEEKLELDQIFKEEFGEEKNPDWETVFEDAPGLLDKLQKFSEMQLEGMDVFMSAFSQLKGFPFFMEISNWFVPFYIENPAIKPAFGGDENQLDLSPLFQKLESSSFICNSDKYSMCFNLIMVPERQKSLMINMFKAEMDSISEIEQGEEYLNATNEIKGHYTQYFQDLYRFYKLHPWRMEFGDIFSLEIDLYESPFVKHLVSGTKTIRNIAELYFDKKFYPDALKVFLGILGNDNSNIELFEKIAFCFEKTGNLEKAYEYYLKADLIESDRPWIMKKLANACKYLNKWEEALSYYRQIEKAEPEDLNIQANIGQCLVHLERYTEALDYYFKIEVLAPENHRIRRPLAWCSFLIGKLDTARDYLERLLEANPGNAHDLQNLGHVLWCQGKPAEALRCYRKSLSLSADLQTFQETFYDDVKYLSRYGISQFDVDLMLDFVKMGEF
ncbi:MAG TPA: tetratricopeptide repeat protein [Bacteroidales bacterium]|nr:tetratricopeptide repeat protein [Bacteroidales bacterium]